MSQDILNHYRKQNNMPAPLHSVMGQIFQKASRLSITMKKHMEANEFEDAYHASESIMNLMSGLKSSLISDGSEPQENLREILTDYYDACSYFASRAIVTKNMELCDVMSKKFTEMADVWLASPEILAQVTSESSTDATAPVDAKSI